MLRPLLSKQNEQEIIKTLNNSQQLRNVLQQPTSNNPSFFQSSKAISNVSVNQEAFSSSRQGFFNDQSTPSRNPCIFTYSQANIHENYSYFQEQSQFRILNFRRTSSEQFDQFELIETPKMNFQFLLRVQNSQLGALEDSKLSRIRKSSDHTEHKSDQLQSYLRLNSNYSQNQKSEKSPENRPQSKGTLVKNVTKNIGKLLFKYIWKNRKLLQTKLSADSQIWETFLNMIRQSKKQNNVTRQFLITRFHGKGEESKLLRVIAHHFFRKHCLSAIFKSKIGSKRIHFQRIKKFKQALTDSKALEYLA